MLLIALHTYPRISITHSQGKASNNVIKTDKWTCRQNNLNIAINLQPKIQVVDQHTHTLFETRKLNNSGFLGNLNARVTITDHGGRRFKSDKQPVFSGKLSVKCIFPGDWQHRVLFQPYGKGSTFVASSFDIVIPHPQPTSSLPPPIDFLHDLFKNIF